MFFMKFLDGLEILPFVYSMESPEFGERCTNGAGKVAKSVEESSIDTD
jgi:hypothetical protein